MDPGRWPCCISYTVLNYNSITVFKIIKEKQKTNFIERQIKEIKDNL